MLKTQMNLRVALVILVTLFLTTTIVKSEPHTVIHKLTDNLYRIECIDQGTANVMVYEGKNGLLVVDAGYWSTRDKLAQTLATIGNGKVVTLILTHGHADHAGGNKPFTADATIIAHENAAKRLEIDFGYTGEDSPIRMPTLTLTDTMTIDFEGEKVRLIHYPASHTDGDIIVHFVNSKVVCLGDLAFSDKLPFVHIALGGTFTGTLKSLESIMATCGDDVTYVPGHGKTMDKTALTDMRGEVVRMVEAVSRGLDEGKDIDQLVAADVLAEWDALSDPVYTTKELLVQLIYQDKMYAGNPPRPIGDVLREVIPDQGIDAAVKLYHDLRTNDPNHYDFNVGELNKLGYYLMAKGKLDEAVAIFKLNIEAFPNHFATYDSMGEAFMNRGDTLLAIRNYEKSLELNSANTNAEDMLEKLRQ